MEQLELDFSSTTVSAHAAVIARGDEPRRVDRPAEITALWRQVSRCKTELATARAQLDTLLEWLNREVADDRAAVAAALTELTERLLAHADKRSLARWQRHEVGLWILDNLQSLDNLGRDTSELVVRYRACFEHFYRSPNAAAADAATESDDWLSRIFTDLPRTESVGDETDEPAIGRAKAHHGDDAPPAEALIVRLFRRTARVLHPDRAESSERRSRNHGLMKTLLKARRDGDVAAILELYLEHAGDAIADADDAEWQYFRDLLQRQLRDLQRALAALAGQSALHGWVVDNLLGKDERQRQRALGGMRAELYELGRQARALTRRVGTLASLKPLLAERHDARHWVSQ